MVNLKSIKATASFAIVALIAGLIFINSGLSTSGNVVINNPQNTTLTPDIFSISLSVIGLLLLVCCIVLALYTVQQLRKK